MINDPLIFVLVLVGLFGGLAAGLLGVGGGIIITPFCAYLYPQLGVSQEILFKVIFGTNFFFISFSSLISAFRFNLKRLVLWRAVFPIAFFSIMGALLGANFAAGVSSVFLKKLFGFFILIVAVRMFFEMKTESGKEPNFSILPLAVTGFSTAILSAMIGVGGGIVTIPIMVFLLHYPMRNAPATSSGIIFFTSIASMLGYMYYGWSDPHIMQGAFGYVDLRLGIPLVMGALVGAPLGTWLNQKISVRRLRQVFGIVLFFVFLKMAFF